MHWKRAMPSGIRPVKMIENQLTIDMRLAAGIIVSSRLRPERPILQQQGMTVWIADHRGARAIGADHNRR